MKKRGSCGCFGLGAAPLLSTSVFRAIRTGEKDTIAIIEDYQRRVDPAMKRKLHTKTICRYHPTCSEYTKEAIKKHGPILGTVKGAFRILRCNPFSKGGHDPVR